MKNTLLIIFLLLLIFTPFAVPARADGTGAITVVLTRSSGIFACGDIVTGGVRITNNLQVPIEVYGSSDSVQVQAFAVAPDSSTSNNPISEQANVGDLVILQPGENSFFAFFVHLSSDPSNYASTASGTVNQAYVWGGVYHSTTYDPSAPVGSLFSGFIHDSGQTGISVSCTQSQPSSSTTTESPTAESTTSESSTSQTGNGDIPEFPFSLFATVIFTVVIVASYLLVRRGGLPSGRGYG